MRDDSNDLTEPSMQFRDRPGCGATCDCDLQELANLSCGNIY